VDYAQAIILGLIQGVTELFPVSSLGHSVILPKLLGWDNIVAAQSAQESFFLAFLVGMHVATALALGFYFWRDWRRIAVGILRSLRTRRVEGSDARLGWLLIVATIPAGIMGLLFEHAFRTVFAKPLLAAAFLIVNGLILLAGEWLRRRAGVRSVAIAHGLNDSGARRLDTLEFREAGVIGLFQVAALLAGISRSGITMVAGLVRGLDHEDAARFSFLLATPIIFRRGHL
jgi:undecaprenyl-diphosphatase